MNYEIKDNQIIVNDCENEEVINYINATVYALNGSIESEFGKVNIIILPSMIISLFMCKVLNLL